MKQNLFNKLWLRVGMIVAIMTTALSGTVWAESVEINTTNFTKPNSGSGYAAYDGTRTISGVDVTSSNVMVQSGNLQFKKSSGYLYNSTAMPGNITKITLGTATNFTIYVGTTENSETQTVTSGSAITGNYTYFKVKCGSSTGTTATITIEYSTGGTSTPSISAENVDIAYDATSGSIAYTINNSVEGGAVSADVTSGDWLTLGTVGATVPFTCSANNTMAARTATVTLTYTYGSNQTATQNVIVTQAADPNAVNNISDITAAGTYTVKGTIVAKSQRGFIVGDGTGYVYYYNTEYAQADYNIGDIVKLDGSVVVYGGVFEFNNSTTITAATESNYVAEEPTVLTGSQMDTRVASTTPAQLSTYVQYEGVLSVSGTYYNITSIDGASTAKGSISYPLSTDFTSLSGKTVKVTGYYVGVSSSQYYNTMLGSIEEVTNADPVISASNVTLAYDATSGEITYTIANPTDATLTATSSASWISNITVGEESVTFTTTANNGTTDREATITLSYTGAEDVTVTVTQGHYVAEFATLPFSFDGGRADIANTSGLTQEGLDTDYGSSPKLKFNTTGDELILKFNESPGKLTFDIKGNGFSGSTFTVQTSEDGVTYTDLETYTELGSTQSESFNTLGENVRYIKWIYTEKVQNGGNVALGNIKLAKYGEAQTYTLSWTAGEHSEIFVFDAEDDSEPLTSGVSVAEGTTIYVSVGADEGYEISALTVKDANNSTITLSEVGENYYSFEMPASNVTITSTATQSGVTPVTGDKYVKVTSTDGLTDGQYLIVYEEGSVAFDGSLETLDAVGNTIEVTISNNEIAATSATTAAEFTIDVAAGTILSASGLYIGQTSDANGLQASDEEEYENTISINDGDADIVSSGSAYLRYNSASNQTRFRYYKSSSYTGQKAIQLYKKVETVEPITVTLNGSGYATFASTKAIDFTDATDYTAWQITGVNEGAIIFAPITGAVAAGTGVLLKGTESQEITLTEAETGTDISSTNKLVGFTVATNVQDNQYYGLKNDKFVKVNAGQVPAGKALLPVSAMTSGVKTFTFIFDDDATGISTVESFTEEGAIFNLAGQRLQKMQKGINIVNGKKVLK